MRHPRCALTLSLILTLALAGPASADSVVWDMDASEDQVNNAGTPDGSTDSSATGHVTLDYDPANAVLNYTVSWQNLEGLLTGIHIHGHADPDESTTSVYFDVLADEADVITAGVDRTTDSHSGQIILADTTFAEISLQFMFTERAYVDLHTSLWPDGEIRAHLDLASVDVTLTKDNQRCMIGMNKSLARVVRAYIKRESICLRIGELTDCRADRRARIDNLLFRGDGIFFTRCRGFDDDGILKRPVFGAFSGNSSFAVEVIGLTGDVLAFPLDGIITDTNRRCQVAVAKQFYKCFNTRLKEFNTCKANGVKGTSAPAGADLPFNDPDDLDHCMEEDPRGKVTRDCDERLDEKINSRCAGLDLQAAFPGCGTSDPTALGDCVRRDVRCRGCIQLNAADNLSRDCDVFDDGISNGTCPP